MIFRFCLAAVLLLPTAAMAQGNPGPFGGLFGRAPARSGLDQTIVEIRSGIGAQYDTDLLAPEGSLIDTTEAGFGSGAYAGLLVAHTADRFNASVRGGAVREHYFRAPESFGVNRYSADARVGGRLSERWDASAAASYAHSPYYQFFRDFGLNSDLAINHTLAPFSPYAVEMLENEDVEASAGLSARITDRSTLSAVVSRRQTRFQQQPESNFESYGYSASWNLQVRRGLGVHVGYGYDHVSSIGAVGGGYDHEVINAGIDFNRALSLARRTTLAFSTSTSIIKQAGSDHQFRVNGNVIFSKYFRRTWSVSAEASRSTEFVPGFFEPVYADFVGASLSGMFSTRLNWMAGVGAARGSYAFSGGPAVDTVTATSRLSIAITRYVEMYGQYAAHFSKVPNGATTLDLPRRTGRQVVAVGIGAYIPIYTKTRAGQ